MPVNSWLFTSSGATVNSLHRGTRCFFNVRAVNSVGSATSFNERSPTPDYRAVPASPRPRGSRAGHPRGGRNHPAATRGYGAPSSPSARGRRRVRHAGEHLAGHPYGGHGDRSHEGHDVLLHRARGQPLRRRCCVERAFRHLAVRKSLTARVRTARAVNNCHATVLSPTGGATVRAGRLWYTGCSQRGVEQSGSSSGS